MLRPSHPRLRTALSESVLQSTRPGCPTHQVFRPSSVQAFCLNAASIPNRGSCCCSCAASAAVVCVSSVHPPNRAVMRRRRDRDRVMNAVLCNLQELKVMPSQLRPGPGPLGGGGMAQPLQPF